MQNLTTQKDLAIETIEDYAYESLFEPNIRWPKIEFDRRVFERWAVTEIVERIKLDPRPPIFAIEDFMNEMDYYISLDQEKKIEFIFRTAREIAEDIGSLLA